MRWQREGTNGRSTRDLSGRRVLVTGASSGIGAATCRAIVDRGGTVAMLARRKERLEDLAEELGATRDRLCAATSPTSAHSRQV